MQVKTPLPFLVVSDRHGRLVEIPELRMTGMSAGNIVVPSADDVIDLPPGSDLFMLPGRTPFGRDPRTGALVPLPRYRGEPVYAAAAFMAPAYMQLLNAACEAEETAPRLPMYAYTAVGWIHGRFRVCGMRVDDDVRQDFDRFDRREIAAGSRRLVRRFPGNRLVRHLMDNCVARYGCPAARNLALGRWECPLPVSRACNAACLACISSQPPGSCVTASQERIAFTPTVEEVVELAVQHLERAPRPVVSFGQGCEGEPLTEGDLLEEAIREIRRHTGKGTINLNTNGSLPDVVDRLCAAGLDSIRVSMNSARPALYEKYHRPRTYRFEEVLRTLRTARSGGCWTSLNYFIFPGLTDHPDEIKALEEILDNVSMIQARNLNMDPLWYRAELGIDDEDHRAIGLRKWLQRLRTSRPDIRIGYFNPYLDPESSKLNRGRDRDRDRRKPAIPAAGGINHGRNRRSSS